MEQLSFDDLLQEWPISITLYAHGTDEKSSMKEYLQDDGLPQWWVNKNVHDMIDVTYEIAVDIDCFEDGSFKVKRIYRT